MKMTNNFPKELLSRNILIISLVINLFLFLLVLNTLTPTIGLDDVYVMLAASGFFTGEPSEFLLISNVILGKILQWLYSSFPAINWYTYILTALNFICMTVILYLFLEKSKSYFSILVFLIIFLVFGVEFYIRIHYTFIAFLCGFTGLFLLIFRSPGNKLRVRILYYCTIFLLFIMAFLVRKESFYGIFAFSILVIIYEVNKRRSLPFAMTLGVVVIIGFVLKLYDAQYYKTNFNSEYSSYFNAQYILNSENKIPQENNPGILSKFDWSENDRALISAWFWVDQNVFGQEKLTQYAAQVQRIKSLKETATSLFNEIVIKPPAVKYLLLFILIFIISLLKKETRNIFYMAMINVAIVCIFLVIFKNLNYRVLRPVWFFLISINVLYIFSHQSINEVVSNKFRKKVLIVLTLVTILISLAVIKHQNDVNRELRHSFDGAFAEITQNPHSIFVFRTIYEVYGFPAYISPVNFSKKNVIITDWFTYSPLYYDILNYHKAGDNLMTEILNNENYFIVNSSKLDTVFIQFFKEHYNTNICYIKMPGYKFLDAAKLSVCK
jgi:hypothetical protein